MEACDHDCFARVMVNIMNQSKRTIPYIHALIEGEIENVRLTSEGAGSALRGNSIASKMQLAYVRELTRTILS